MEDHPRSRGVYGGRDLDGMHECGSSPLARGLQLEGAVVADRTGIIPARAGFTAHQRRRTGEQGDHPRSRGVYRPLTSSAAFCAGSSPLARGLPWGRGCCSCWSRIIPARAGFTAGSSRSWRSAGDHPRSRGVYSSPCCVGCCVLGSSPLARGLRRRRRGRVPEPGIIPARAGFTTANQISHVRVKDHPRSRGVYFALWDDGFENWGSSPLARGLRMVATPVADTFGIIPARAGFT